MSSVVLTGNTSGSVTVAVPAVAGSNTATIGAATGTHYPFTAGTAVASTSGTSIDFTSIPSWVKRITVMFNGVSLNGSSSCLVQAGSGSVQSTGYSFTYGVAASGTAWTAATVSNGVPTAGGSASRLLSGHIVLTNLSGNLWVGSGVTNATNTDVTLFASGNVTLSGTLDRVRITTVNGTDTFDAGSINILYE